MACRGLRDDNMPFLRYGHTQECCAFVVSQPEMIGCKKELRCITDMEAMTNTAKFCCALTINTSALILNQEIERHYLPINIQASVPK